MDVTAFQRWEKDHPHASLPPIQQELSQKLKPQPAPFGRLPPQAARTIFTFLRMYPGALMYDLQAVDTLLEDGDINGLREFEQPDAVVGRLKVIHDALGEHQNHLALFDAYGAALHLPPGEPHPQREAVTDLLRSALRKYQFLYTKWAVVADWVKYCTVLQDTPVHELRNGMRGDVERIQGEVARLHRQYIDDCVVTRLATEVTLVANRVGPVEALGDPQLTDKDFHDIFWRLGLPYPGGEGYPQSITYKQAVTLDLFAGNPVYSWEGRHVDVVPDETPHVDPAVEAAAREAEAERERAARAAEEAARERTAAGLVADMMKAGCEVCQDNMLTHVGLGKRTGCDPIVLCRQCYPEYEGSPAVHKLYRWYEVAELLKKKVQLPSIRELDAIT